MTSRVRIFLGDHGDLAVFLTALVVRLAWVATLRNEIRWIDEQQFAEIARHLADGDGYVSSSFRANPIVPAYLGVIYRLFGENYVIGRIGQSLMGAAACVLVGRIAATMIGAGAGLLSGFLLAVYPPHIFLAGLFYVDTWLTFFAALTVYLTVLVAQGRGGVVLALLCGVSQGLAVLTRPAFLAFLPGPVLAFLVSESLRDRGRRALLCGIFLLGCAATVLPWVYRNNEVFGRPIIASGFGAMLWRGNHELSDGGPDDRFLDWTLPWWEERLQALPEARERELRREYELVQRRVAEREREIGDYALAMDDVLKPLAVDAILSHPGRTVRLILAKVGTLYSAFSETATANDRTIPLRHVVAPLTFYPLLVMGILGAILGLPRWRELAPIYFLIASITGVYALLTACTRFRLPLDPFLIILSSLAIVKVAHALGLGSLPNALAEGSTAARRVESAGQGRHDAATAPRGDMPLHNAPHGGTHHA
jgi:4-amino-4-deoxy-L-arabinose transferase-like glycosyltransferase